ncbi:NIPSNAP family protein [Burkholderia stabilis]|uniref:NIPSNAP family protein n=1 Tax=Burkholderia stabilis TaxID=95485 RepID=UPI0015929647|nr:NIPSNAP family protein [Burkholderia stabilis]
MNRLLEIRTYRLKPGTLHAFHAAMHELAVPMIRASGMDVVCYGHSDHEEESYCLVRAYTDRHALETEQAAFYHSAAWREGPRQALVVHIDTYLNTLLWMTDEAVESLRTLNRS